MTLEDLRKLCKKATPGPWEYTDDSGFPCFRMRCEKNRGNGWHTVEIDTCDGRASYNAKLIAAARAYLPKLLAVAEAAKSLSDNIAEFDTITDNCFIERVDDALKALEAE